MKTAIYLSIIIIFSSCSPSQDRKSNANDFSFAFMTDIHLRFDRNSVDGFKQSIEILNKLNPDFLLTGGDLVEHGSMCHADSIYKLYVETSKQINIPIHSTIGNKDCFDNKKYDKTENVSVQDRKRMYKQYIGDTYYSFSHKGWHFMALDALSTFEDSVGNIIEVSRIDSIQMEWIRGDLANLDPLMPIVISTHIPFLHSQISLIRGNYKPIGANAIIDNSNEVLNLFKNYNLRLVLQGHMHNLDDINLNNKVRFITGGAVCAEWWKGAKYPDNPLFKMEEGFLTVHIINDEISWEYIDFGWEATNK